MKKRNIYIILSADSDTKEADKVQSLFLKDIANKNYYSTCLTYKTCLSNYDVYDMEADKLSNFLKDYREYCSFFWIVLLKPISQGEKDVHFDESLWLRLGILTGLLIEKGIEYNGHITYWSYQRISALESLLIPHIRSYSEIPRYIDSVEDWIGAKRGLGFYNAGKFNITETGNALTNDKNLINNTELIDTSVEASTKEYYSNLLEILTKGNIEAKIKMNRSMTILKDKIQTIHIGIEISMLNQGQRRIIEHKTIRN